MHMHNVCVLIDNQIAMIIVFQSAYMHMYAILIPYHLIYEKIQGTHMHMDGI